MVVDRQRHAVDSLAPPLERLTDRRIRHQRLDKLEEEAVGQPEEGLLADYGFVPCVSAPSPALGTRPGGLPVANRMTM